MRRLTLSALALLATSTFASANEYAGAMQDYLQSELAGWIADPVIVAAIKAQNETSQGYSQGDIDSMDTEWRSQVGTGNAPLVDQVLSNPASDFLRSHLDASGGVITEVFIMDARGLNVAATDAPSDMWQGDEAKFQQTFPNGAGANHFSDIEFDESTQTYQGQISVSVTDPATGETIGAITIGVDAESLL